MQELKCVIHPLSRVNRFTGKHLTNQKIDNGARVDNGFVMKFDNNL